MNKNKKIIIGITSAILLTGTIISVSFIYANGRIAAPSLDTEKTEAVTKYSDSEYIEGINRQAIKTLSEDKKNSPETTKETTVKPKPTKAPAETSVKPTQPLETEPAPTPTPPVETEPAPTQPVETSAQPTQPVETQPVPTQPVETQPAPTQPPVSSASTLEQKMLEAVNNYRASQGLTRFSAAGSDVVNVAVIRAGESAQKFSHDRPDGTKVFDLIRAHGIQYSRAAENLAMVPSGYSADQVLELWLKSPGHLTNIRGDYKYLAVGIYTDSQGYSYWTQIFIG